jgi:poly(A) polymerase
MRLRGIGPGPEVGKTLEALREAQAAGEVRSRQEAERFVDAYLA